VGNRRQNGTIAAEPRHYRIGQLADWPVDQLKKILAKFREIHERANGIDTSPVSPDPAPAKSVSQETTFFMT
jgi:nucleotidyltransferase/DNA polymerase involved in DNA repair